MVVNVIGGHLASACMRCCLERHRFMPSLSWKPTARL